MTTYPDQVRRQERAAARKRRRCFKGPAIVTLRMAELFKVFNHRYGSAPLPDDDAGRDDLKLMFQVLSTTQQAGHRMVADARTWAPWYPAAELAVLVADVEAHPRRFKADTIAARLGVTAALRDELKLRTIGAIDKPAEQRAAERREKQRLAKELKRRAAGVVTITEARALRAKREPWKTAGISRSTWYRRRQRAALGQRLIRIFAAHVAFDRKKEGDRKYQEDEQRLSPSFQEKRARKKRQKERTRTTR